MQRSIGCHGGVRISIKRRVPGCAITKLQGLLKYLGERANEKVQLDCAAIDHLITEIKALQFVPSAMKQFVLLGEDTVVTDTTDVAEEDLYFDDVRIRELWKTAFPTGHVFYGYYESWLRDSIADLEARVKNAQAGIRRDLDPPSLPREMPV